MKIYALDSDNEEYQNLIDQISKKIPVDVFDDINEIIESVEEDCGGILLDFDKDTRKKNKMITTLKKEFDGLNIFLLANSLDAKKMSKHQNSKTGAHLYFQMPMDDEVLTSMLETFFEFENDQLSESDVIAEHSEGKELSEELEEKSSQIDNVFQTSGVGDSSLSEPSSSLDDGGLSLGGLEMGDESQNDSPAEDFSEEMSLDDSPAEEFSAEMSLDDSPMEEMSLDDSSVEEFSAEMSLDDSPMEEMSLDDDSSDEGFSLGGEDNATEDNSWQEDEELSLNADDEDESGPGKLPSDEDLTFPDFDQPEELKSSSEEDQVKSSGVGELELGDTSMELSLSEDTGVTELPEDTGEFDLKISEMTSPSQVMDLEHTNNELEMNSDDNDDIENDLEMLGDDSTDEDSDDLSFGLSSEDEENSSGDMNTGVDVIGGLDEELNIGDMGDDEITRPTMSNELEELAELEESEIGNLELSEGSLTEDDDDDIDSVLAENNGLNVNIPNNYENSQSMDVDALLAGSGDLDEEDDSEVQSEETATIVGVAMSHSNKDELAKDEAVLKGNPVKASVEEDSKTSITMNQELTSLDLPDELPDFSTSVAGKLDEIDDLMDDNITSMHNAYQAEDKTLVAASSEDATNFYQRPDDFENESDATVVQKIPQNFNDDKTSEIRVQTVPQDLKQEHREYVENYNDELVRLGETIKSLRLDREELLEQIHQFESREESKKDNQISLQAQLDEKKIEVAVVKKRMEKQIDDLRFQLDITLDKKEFLSKQNEDLSREVEKLSKQSKLDVNKVRYRERELEEKLEMLRKDAEIQIRNRDKKILELKRKIDSLEFDIESAQMKEKRSTTTQIDLEDRMNKVIKTLRGAIGQLEEDYGAEERINKIKKNLDL